MQKINPCLWFDTEGEEAANFYTSIFKNSSILQISRYGEAGPRPEGTVMTVLFELDGQRFTALNGGPEFTFSEAISLQIHCETQEEVDRYWETLSEGGEEGRRVADWGTGGSASSRHGAECSRSARSSPVRSCGTPRRDDPAEYCRSRIR